MISLGVLGIGDAAGNGRGRDIRGIPAQPWALWLAQAADVPCTLRVFDEASSADLVAQVPEVQARDAQSRRWSVGALAVGTNDVVRGVPVSDSAENFRAIVAGMSWVCERVVVAMLHDRIGRPGRRAESWNTALKWACQVHGAILFPVKGLNAPPAMQGDNVRPTALGSLWMADRAAEALNLECSASSLVQIPKRPGLRYHVDRWTDSDTGIIPTFTRGLLRPPHRQRPPARRV